MKVLIAPILTVLFLVGCEKPKDEIVPLVPVEKIADSQKTSQAQTDQTSAASGAYATSSGAANSGAFGSTSSQGELNASQSNTKSEELFNVKGIYKFKSFDVEQPVNSEISLLDIALNKIISAIVSVGGNFEVISDPIPIDMSDVNFDIVKEVFILNVEINIEEPEKTNADLRFIKSLQIMLVDEENPLREFLLVDYQSDEEINQLRAQACNYKCLNIPANQANIIDFINESKFLKIVPIVKIGAAPTENFAITGKFYFKSGLIVNF